MAAGAQGLALHGAGDGPSRLAMAAGETAQERRRGGRVPASGDLDLRARPATEGAARRQRRRGPAALLCTEAHSAAWCGGRSSKAPLGPISFSSNGPLSTIAFSKSGGPRCGLDAFLLPELPFLSRPIHVRPRPGQCGSGWPTKDPLRRSLERRVPVGIVAALPTSAGRHSGAREGPGAKETAKVLRILVSTGDVMGNIHAANLIRAIRAEFHAAQVQGRRGLAGAELQVYAIGSRLLEDSGAVLVASTDGLSSIGLLEAIPFILPAFSVLETAKKFLADFVPDAIVLVDYPGINMRLGNIAREVLGSSVQIHYFIPPNEWLFWPWRAQNVANLCDTIICTYGDEAAHYQATGASVLLNGHPLADCCRSVPCRTDSRRLLGVPEDATVVALVPASREQELRLVWPVLLTSAEMMLAEVWGKAAGKGPRGAQGPLLFVIPVAEEKFLAQLSQDCAQSPIGSSTILSLVNQSGSSTGPTESLEPGSKVAGENSKGPRTVALASSLHALSAADVALTKSGSVTLQLALLGVPQVVVYRLSAVTAFLARRVFGFKPEYVSLVNLMLGVKAVPEFLQEAATPAAVSKEAMGLMDESAADTAEDAKYEGAKELQLHHYARLREEIAGGKESYGPAAVHILERVLVAADSREMLLADVKL